MKQTRNNGFAERTVTRVKPFVGNEEPWEISE